MARIPHGISAGRHDFSVVSADGRSKGRAVTVQHS
jgi:hypothetical protein